MAVSRSAFGETIEENSEANSNARDAFGRITEQNPEADSNARDAFGRIQQDEALTTIPTGPPGLTYDASKKQWINVPEKTDNPIYDLAPTGAAANYQQAIDNYRNAGGKDANLLSQFENIKQDLRRQDASNEAANIATTQLNAENKALNELNAKKNNAYNKVIATASTAQKGDYLSQREGIRKLDIDEKTRKELETSYRQFYVNEKLDKWDPVLSSKPLYGDFDPKYYKENNKDVAAAWKQLVDNDDVDVVERYGENGFYANHYTNYGKTEKRRANAAEIAGETEKYQNYELKKTDAEIADIRDRQLGFKTTTQTSRLIKEGSAIKAEWDKAIKGDPYWKNQAKEKYLEIDATKPDEFLTLFRLSERPEDKEILKKTIGTEGGITELEDAFNQAVGAEALVETKKFGALAQDVLKETIAEMKKAKGKEQALSLYKGLGGFSEILDINKQLTNSLLGDTGIGGILSQMGDTTKTKEDLEKKLENVTGVRNNVVYNWENWFKDTLTKRYQEDIELGYKTEDSEEKLKIDGAFAKKFVDTYLTPRFNTSRSMDEFMEYIDVRQEEQNPFQTQDIMNAVKVVADQRTTAYLQAVQGVDHKFNADFYFNPTGDKSRENEYAEQASTVAADWETAKNNPNALVDPKRPSLGTWAGQAYRFGLETLNDKKDFARIHFQLIGSLPKDPNDAKQGIKFDGAEDIINAGKIQDEIYKNILPALSKEAKDLGSVFGLFKTPEEFTDKLLEGINPEDTEAWDKILKANGLETFKGTIDELKEAIKEVLRTGSAQTIRENIKYLNEKRERPTQEKLGITYIERPEDYKTGVPKSDTALYTTFQNAGYKGTEDEFYEKFFPDTDRSEQEYLTKALTGKSFEATGLTLSKDPFENLNTIEGMFPEEKEINKKKDDNKTKTSSQFFRLGLDDEDDEDYDYNSKSGSDILEEFTKNFK